MEASTKWEYIFLTFGGPLLAAKDEKVQASLNELGIDGWEVVSAIAIDNSAKIKILAKRPLSSLARRQRTFPT